MISCPLLNTSCMYVSRHERSFTKSRFHRTCHLGAISFLRSYSFLSPLSLPFPSVPSDSFTYDLCLAREQLCLRRVLAGSSFKEEGRSVRRAALRACSPPLFIGDWVYCP